MADQTNTVFVLTSLPGLFTHVLIKVHLPLQLWQDACDGILLQRLNLNSSRSDSHSSFLCCVIVVLEPFLLKGHCFPENIVRCGKNRMKLWHFHTHLKKLMLVDIR